MLVSCTVQAWLRCRADAAFDLTFDAQRFPALFRGFGLIQPIRAVSPRGANLRRIEMRGGTSFDEWVTSAQRPRHGPGWHAYVLHDLQAPLRWLLRGADACWTFTPDGDGCRVSWRYAFAPRARWATPLAAALLHAQMRPAMRRCLHAIEVELAQRQNF